MQKCRKGKIKRLQRAVRKTMDAHRQSAVGGDLEALSVMFRASFLARQRLDNGVSQEPSIDRVYAGYLDQVFAMAQANNLKFDPEQNTFDVPVLRA